MSREVKRVALDFDWPLSKVWKGYLNDRANLASLCPACDGTSQSPMARHLYAQWYGHASFSPQERGSQPLLPTDAAIWAFAARNVTRSPNFYGQGDTAILREAQRLCDMWNTQWNHHLNEDDVDALIAANRLFDLTHTCTIGQGWTPKSPRPRITAEEVNVWNINSMGHDSINAWVCIKAECARRGHAYACDTCAGAGQLWPSPGAKAAHEAWERTDPPSGEGYQLWATVNEGCPISPVFATHEALAQWLSTHRPKDGLTVSDWLAFLRVGWCPSAVGVPTAQGLTVMDGLTATLIYKEEISR